MAGGCELTLRLGLPTLSPAVAGVRQKRLNQTCLRWASSAVLRCQRPSDSVCVNAGSWPRSGKREWRRLASEDDFETEDVLDYEMDGPEDEEDENDMRDYDVELDLPLENGFVADRQSKAVDFSEAGEVETVVDYKINEAEFHKLSLHQCDFFIRKVPDPDNDVYDFGEMYVTPPDTDVYAIPKRKGIMPKKPIRLTKSSYEYINVTEPPVDSPRAPLYKSEKHVMKVFLMKHYRNRRSDDYDFVMDFEEIYVIDTRTKTISRAPVSVEVPGGRKRDRSNEVLTVRDDGNTFRIIPQSERKTPCEIVGALQWERSRDTMENYLRGFRDYEVSNWF